MMPRVLPALLLTLTAGAVALAQSTRPADPGPVFKDSRGLALKGYDVVAYHEGTAVEGKADFETTHTGATYRFASAEHLAAFKADPAKYLPQYGGFCALGMAGGYKAPTDPLAFKLVDGKLYLNYSPKVAEMWQKDLSGNIAKADANWKKLNP